MAVLRSVAKTDTFEIQRQKINLLAQDVYNVQTSVGEGAFSMSDGSVQEPALFFTNAQDVGIFRGGQKSLYIGSEGYSVASFDKNYLTSLQNFRTLISAVPTGTNGITLTNGGQEYSPGVFNQIPLTGGSGTGLKANLTVKAIEGDILTGGNGYVGGSYVSVPMIGGLGTGAVADITVSPFSGSIQNGGTGGNIGSNNSQIFTNVSLTGGSGNSMRADITVTNAAGNVSVTGVSIVNQGTGYQTGNVLSAVSNTIGGVTGFQYVINGVGNVTQIQILLANSGYEIGDILTANNSSLGGSGSGFQFEVTGVGIVSDAIVTAGGDGYLVGDQLTVNPVELSPTETWYVRMWVSQIFNFSGTLPSSGFNIGDSLTYDGESRTIVKRFTDQTNKVESVVVRAGSEDGGSIQFSAGLFASDGNGNSALVGSSSSKLNYYFSLTPDGPFENVKDFTFQKNKRYIFNQSNSSNNTHPIRFSTTPDGIHTVLGGQGAQTDFGDPYEGSEVNYQYTSVDVSIVPNDSTPTTLYYYCSNGFGDPLNQHIDEGGFDGREGKITISGSAEVSGSGLNITISAVDTESNIILNKDGSAILGEIEATSLSLLSDLTISGSAEILGDFTLGSNKFNVNALTGNTTIVGSLTVEDELSFLSDCSFGSTLYVDSVNNRVSINVDPEITQLTKSFEVDGTVAISDEVYLAENTNSSVKIGNDAVLSQGSKLQVDGSIYTNTFYYSNAAGDTKKPTYSFNNLDRVGLSANSSDKSLSLISTSGECFKINPTEVISYRNTNFNKLQILSSSHITGEGYEIGNYSGLELIGGTGSELVVDITVAFVGTITNNGDGYVDGSNYNALFSDGSGSGASLKFSVVNNQISEIIITNGGSNYEVGDILTINTISITNENNDPVIMSPSIVAEYTIDFLGSITVVDITNSGEGYLSGDVLELNPSDSLVVDQILPIGSLPWLPENDVSLGDYLYYNNILYEVTVSGTLGEIPPSHISGFAINGSTELTFVRYIKFALIIGDTSTETTVNIDKDLGKITTFSIETTGEGILVDNRLSIDGSTISSTQNEDVIISPGSSQKLLFVDGSGGIRVPVGTSTNRPSATTLGIVRYNSQTQQYEGSNGANFISLGGVRDVDGNTYIIAEEETGANDNILYFFNDADNSARFNRNELELVTATTISSKDTDGKFKWKASTSYDLNSFVYHEINLYQVTTAGITGLVAPSHTTGTATNGTATLNYIGTTYGDLTFKANNINLDGGLTLSGSLDLYSLSDNLVFENSDNSFKFAFGNNNGVPNVALSITDSGILSVNKNYNTLNPENNINIIDYTAKFIELDDVKIQTFDLTLTKGATETGNVTIYDPDLYKGAKVIIIAENISSGDSHIVEYNIISKGSDIYVNEYGNLDTGTEQYSIVWNFNPSGDIQGNITLASSLTAGNNVIITSSITKIKK